MPGTVKVNTQDLSYEAVDANLASGVMCIPSTTATTTGLQGVKVAGDAAVNALGVSANGAVTAANQAAAQNTTDGNPEAFPVLSLGVDDVLVTLYDHAVCWVTYTAAAVAYGARLCCAASGAVRAWVSGTDPASAIIGFCANPGGVSSAGGLAKAFIRI